MSRIFGQIAQIGYVVRDIRASMDNWVQSGVGPWFYVDRVQLDYFRHRGVDSDMEMSVAVANSGDIQIELIKPRNDAPSVYKEFLDSGREGMQHIAYWTTDYQFCTTRPSPSATRSRRKAPSAARRAASPTWTPNTIRARSSRSPTSAGPRACSSPT